MSNALIMEEIADFVRFISHHFPKSLIYTLHNNSLNPYLI